jgi:hypothetical protein
LSGLLALASNSLCLAIHEVYPEALSMPYHEVYYSYYPDLIGDGGSEWR